MTPVEMMSGNTALVVGGCGIEVPLLGFDYSDDPE